MICNKRERRNAAEGSAVFAISDGEADIVRAHEMD